jgi:hypothetical protein
MYVFGIKSAKETIVLKRIKIKPYGTALYR